MTDATQPEWMKGFKPNPVLGNPDWKRGGPSPNKSGRPKGVVDRRMKMTQALRDEAPAIIRTIIAAALDGDMQAAALCLSRCSPVLRAQSEPVQFEFDASAPIAQQVEQVLQAISEGAVPVEVGKQIIEAISTLSAVRESEVLRAEMEARFAALERKQA